MTSNQPSKRRRSIRFKGYNYSQPGAYFVTICVQGGACLLGEIVEGEMILNPAGEMAADSWLALPQRFESIDLDAMIVMPNHLHGILLLDQDWAATRAAPTLGEIIGAFKSITTNEYIQSVTTGGWPAFDVRLWQRNYWERIIRNERELAAFQRYIWNNPVNWRQDKLYTGEASRWRP